MDETGLLVSGSFLFLRFGILFVEEFHGQQVDLGDIRSFSLLCHSTLCWKDTEYSDVFKKGPLHGFPAGEFDILMTLKASAQGQHLADAVRMKEFVPCSETFY